MSDAKQSQKTRARTQAWRERMRDRGLVKLELWVRPNHRDPLRWAAQQLLDGKPAEMVAASTTGQTIAMEMDMPEQWTTESLKAALQDQAQPGFMAGELSVEMIDGAAPALKVSMHLYGDLEVFVSVEGEQILASVLLWPVAEQAETDAFNRMILGLNKAMPLSAFGITQVGEDAYYELFGALSSRSVLPSIQTELRTLAANAIDVVSELHPLADAEAA